MDWIFIKDLALKSIAGTTAWGRRALQPLIVSLAVTTDIRAAAANDDLGASLNYDVLQRKVGKAVDGQSFATIELAAESVAQQVLAQCRRPGQQTHVKVLQPEALLRANGRGLEILRQLGSQGIEKAPNTPDTVTITGLKLATLIGVFNHERLARQIVEIDLHMHALPGSSTSDIPLQAIADNVGDHVEAAEYKTVESMAENVAELVCAHSHVAQVRVKLGKPSAVTFARSAGMDITRSLDDFDAATLKELNASFLKQASPEALRGKYPPTPVDTSLPVHSVYLAFGTNIGDRMVNIRQSIEELDKRGIKVLRTSSIYESEPMYVQDQDRFYNGVFACTTTLSPHDLLAAVKDIEYNIFKRVKLIHNGPRPMDLDILIYDDAVISTPDLIVPHADMLNRSFVLQPLVDVAPKDLLHPLSAESYASHLAELPESSESQVSSQVTTVVPLEAGFLPVDPIAKSKPTLVMAILNVTPDSFSDGGSIDAETIVEAARQHVANGADILDIGGASTRPGSAQPTLEEELERVVPAITRIREDPSLKDIPISVDTYRSEVARQALAAGANIINDVFAGERDPSILTVAAETGAPIVLSHARGSPETMNSLATYDSVVSEVGEELEAAVQKAQDAGVRRWQIIADPGFGFAKNLDHNLDLLRHFKDLRNRPGLQGLPWLVGTSRKRFVGTVTGVDNASDRVMGTATTAAALVEQGADIVRVHDTKAISEAVKMADAIYRSL